MSTGSVEKKGSLPLRIVVPGKSGGLTLVDGIVGKDLKRESRGGAGGETGVVARGSDGGGDTRAPCAHSAAITQLQTQKLALETHM